MTTQPFTPEATIDWQLGEIDAIEGKSPYPVRTAREFNGMPVSVESTAYGAGFHLAYKRLHGRDWTLPTPELPANAIAPWFHATPTGWTPSSVQARMRDIIEELACGEGINPAGVIHAVVVDLHFPQHCRTCIAKCVQVTLNNPTDHRNKVQLSHCTDHLKGEYDFRPWLETEVLPKMREIDHQITMFHIERDRRRAARDTMSLELTRVFGAQAKSWVTYDERPELSLAIHIASLPDAGAAALLEALKTMPAHSP